MRIINLAQFDIDDTKLNKALVENAQKIAELKKVIKEAEQNAKNFDKQIATLKTSIASNTKIQDDANKKLKEGKINQEQYNTIVAKSSAEIKASTTSIANLNTEQTKSFGIITNTQIKYKELSDQQRELLLIQKAGRTETSENQNTYRNLSKELNALKTEAKNLGAELYNLEKAGKSNTQEYKDLQKSFLDTSKKADDLNNVIKGIDKSFGDNQRNVGNYRDSMREAFQDILRGDIANGFDRLKQSVGGFFTSFKSSIATLVTSPLFITLGAITGIGILIDRNKQTVIDFDSALIKVGKTSGLAGLELRVFGSSVVQLSKDLNNVVSSKKLLEYASVAAQLGIKGRDNLLQFSEALAKLETATNVSGEAGASSIARLLQLADGGSQNVKAFGDELVKLGNNSAATESEILDNATAIAQGSASFDIGRQNILAYGAATKSVGLDAEATGTSFARTFNDLRKAIAGNGVELDNYAKISGMTNEQFKQLFKDDKAGALNAFLGGLNKVYKSGGDVNGILDQLGITEIRQARLVNTLATKGYDPLVKSLENVKDASGSLDKEFTNGSARISVQIERLKNVWDNFILSLDDGQGVFSSLFKFMVDTFVGGLTFLSQNINLVVFSLAGFVLALNGAKIAQIALVTQSKITAIAQAAYGFVQDLLTGKITLTSLATRGLGLAMKSLPFAFIGTLIGGLIGYFIDLYNTNVRFKASISATFSVVSAIFNALIKTISNFGDIAIKVFNGIPLAIKDSFSGVGNVASAIFSGQFDKLPNLLKDLGKKIVSANPLSALVSEMVNETRKSVGDIEKIYNDSFNNSLKQSAVKKEVKNDNKNNEPINPKEPIDLKLKEADKKEKKEPKAKEQIDYIAKLSEEKIKLAQNELTKLKEFADASLKGDKNYLNQRIDQTKSATQILIEEENKKFNHDKDLLQQRLDSIKGNSQQEIEEKAYLSTAILNLESERGLKKLELDRAQLESEQALRKEFADIEAQKRNDKITTQAQEDIKNVEDGINKEFDVKLIKEQEQRDLELSNAEQKKQEDLIIAGDNEALQLEAQNNFEAKKAEVETAYAENSKKIEKEKKEYKLGLLSDVFGAVSDLFGKETAMGKAAAIAQATINTYLGATKALAELPPPFSYIMAGITVATGLKNVATIAGIGAPKKAEKGMTILGGKPHSQGGTMLYDQTGTPIVEAEQGESVHILKKSATNELLNLSLLNQKHGGIALGGKPSMYMAQGGTIGQTSVITNQFKNVLDANLMAEIIGKKVYEGSLNGSKTGASDGIYRYNDKIDNANQSNL